MSGSLFWDTVYISFLHGIELSHIPHRFAHNNLHEFAPELTQDTRESFSYKFTAQVSWACVRGKSVTGMIGVNVNEEQSN